MTHVNEDQAIIEMSIRAKKINIPLADLKEVDQDKLYKALYQTFPGAKIMLENMSDK